MVISTYTTIGGILYYSLYSNGSWSSFTQIQGGTIPAIWQVHLSNDGSIGIVTSESIGADSIPDGSFCYFRWNSSTNSYGNLINIDKTNCNPNFAAISGDGTTIVAPRLLYQISFSKWNGNGFNTFTPTVRDPILSGQSCFALSYDASKLIILQGNTAGYIRLWKPEINNYGISLLMFILNNPYGNFCRCTISPDENRLFVLTTASSNPCVFYANWNSTLQVFESPVTYDLSSANIARSFYDRVAGISITTNGDMYLGFGVPNTVYKVSLTIPSQPTASSILTNFANFNVNDNKWRHFVWTIDPNGTYTYYINNNPIYNVSNVLYPPSVVRNVNYIGNAGFVGAIDDFRMYTHVLNSTEISNIYSNTIPFNTYIDYGITGPQGPTGNIGDTGPQGPRGIGYSLDTISTVIIDASFGKVWSSMDIDNGLPLYVNFSYMGISSNGVKAIGVVNGGKVYITNDVGTTWNIPVAFSSTSTYQYCSCTSDFTKLTVCSSTTLYVSTNSGASWVTRDVSNILLSASSLVFAEYSSDGTLIYASGSNGLYVSTNDGITFTKVNNLGLYPLLTNNIAISSDNNIVLIEVKYNTYQTMLFISRDAGQTWIEIVDLPDNPLTVSSTWKMTMSYNGETIMVGMGVFVYISRDYGQTWTRISNIYGIPLMSSDASKMVVCSDANYNSNYAFNVSVDSGITWTSVSNIDGMNNSTPFYFAVMSSDAVRIMVSSTSKTYLSSSPTNSVLVYNYGFTGPSRRYRSYRFNWTYWIYWTYWILWTSW